MSNTQLLSHNPNGVTYGSADFPDFSVRFKTVRTPKRLDSLRTVNLATEIIINDKKAVTKDQATADDSVSVRIRCSGSALSHERLSEILKGVSTQLPIWADENVILGFEPKTLPAKY